MAEGYAFAEGEVWLWTGANPSSAVAFVQNINVALSKGVVNQQTVNGQYYDVVTGRRADVSFTPVFADMAMYRLFHSPTAVHMKLNHVVGGASAGFLLYSGIFDNLSINGAEGAMMQSPMTYHANVWSAYGE